VVGRLLITQKGDNMMMNENTFLSSYNFYSEGFQDTLERGFAKASEWESKWIARDIGRDHRKYLLKLRTKSIV